MNFNSYTCSFSNLLKSGRMKIFSKLTFAVIAFVGMTQVISAQTVNKSAWMVGGSAQFFSYHYHDDDNNITIYTLNAALGYFFADDLALGVSVGSLNSSHNGTSNHETSIGPFLRYYISDPIYIQLKADLGLTSQEGTVIGGEVGYSLFLNNSVALEPAVFYNFFSTNGGPINNNVFGVSLGIQAFSNRNH